MATSPIAPPSALGPDRPRLAAWLDNRSCILALLAGIAFVVRAYHLDGPSMWGDEIFGPIMATKPLAYLMRWNWLEDVHPPLFYFVMKGVLALSHSDFALRLPAVACGVLSVLVMYRVGEAWLDKDAGLLAAAVLAVTPAHLYLSRVVRFYSFTVLLCLVGLWLLKRYLDHRENGALGWLVAVLALLLLAEFTSLMPLAAFFAILLAIILARPGRKAALGRCIRYGAAAFALPLVFLVMTTLQRRGFAVKATPFEALENFWRTVAVLVTAPAGPNLSFWWLWLLPLLAVAGAVRLARTGRRLLAVALSFLVFPALVIMAIRPAYCLSYWHLFFLIPILALLAAAGLEALVPAPYRPRAALGVGLLGAVALLGPLAGHYYAPTAYGEDPREAAKAVVGDTLPGSPILQDAMGVDFVDWYARQYALDDRLADQRVEPRQGPLTLNIVLGAGGGLGHLADAAHPVSDWATVTADRPLGVSRLVKAVVQRQPEVPLDLSGKPLELDAHPARFYTSVHQAAGVTIYPYWGNAVIATANDAPASFSYRLTNPGGGGHTAIRLGLLYRNIGRGNRFTAKASFDGQPSVTLVDSHGPEAPNARLTSDDPLVERTVSLRREEPFTTLDVTFELTCALITPHYPTSNLMTVGFSKLTVAARPYGPDLMDEAAMDPLVSLTGLGGVEHEGERRWRWATGPKNSLDFSLERDTPLRLTYAFVNPFHDQGYTLTANGAVLARETGLARTDWKDPASPRTVAFTGKAGPNSLAFAFDKVNHVNDAFTEADATPYAAAFTVLRLETGE
ncbi:MAG: glycosyltransferase family 39 protein [Solidesulfovibrio sp. DCME]|uniref:glycosyltransferase family 39 protein n=1 Tax=Solidesulfovibrio sp. DCME TaxID=3447380 RepID=UPI003D143BE2